MSTVTDECDFDLESSLVIHQVFIYVSRHIINNCCFIKRERKKYDGEKAQQNDGDTAKA